MLAYCAITNNKKGFCFFRDNLDAAAAKLLQGEDIYAKKAEFYVNAKKWSLS